MKQIVIFDMDGTLIDSQLDITVSINYVRHEHHGLPPLEPAYVVDAINAHQRNLALLFYNTHTYHEKDRLLFEEHYHEQCTRNVALYDEVADVLEAFAKRDILLSVATNAPSPFACRMLEHLNVAHHFDRIVGADMVINPKPHAEMLHTILDHYGYDPSRDRAWMVGDNSKDMEAAKLANITAVFAAWGFSECGEGDHIACKPLDLKTIIAKG